MSLFSKENASGYYRVSTFFIAKLVCDLLPMRLIPSILFSILTYFMTGFRVSANQFFIYFLTIFLSTIFGSATCFAVASFIPIFGKTSHLTLYRYILLNFSGIINCGGVYLCCNDGVQWFSD